MKTTDSAPRSGAPPLNDSDAPFKGLPTLNDFLKHNPLFPSRASWYWFYRKWHKELHAAGVVFKFRGRTHVADPEVYPVIKALVRGLPVCDARGRVIANGGASSGARVSMGSGSFGRTDLPPCEGDSK